MRLAMLLLLACSACGRIGFEARNRDGDADGGLIDGADPTGDGGTGDSATGASCLDPGNGSTFPGGSPCTDWAANVATTNASIAESGGQLVITPSPNTGGAQGSCTRNLPYGAGGAIVEVSAVLAGGGTITAIQLGLGPTALSMVVNGGQLLAQDASGTLGQVAYSATTTRFWRIRPAGNTMSVFEYGDGTKWMLLGVSNQAPLATYDAQLIAGEITATPAPGSARFESVNICP